MRPGGLGDAPRPLVEEFARIKSGEEVKPAAGAPTRPPSPFAVNLLVVILAAALAVAILINILQAVM